MLIFITAAVSNVEVVASEWAMAVKIPTILVFGEMRTFWSFGLEKQLNIVGGTYGS